MLCADIGYLEDVHRTALDLTEMGRLGKQQVEVLRQMAMRRDVLSIHAANVILHGGLCLILRKDVLSVQAANVILRGESSLILRKDVLPVHAANVILHGELSSIWTTEDR